MNPLRPQVLVLLVRGLLLGEPGDRGSVEILAQLDTRVF